MSADERRQNIRPAPLKPRFNLRVDAIVYPLMHGFQKPYRGIFLLALFVSVCIAWVIWCINVRMVPVQVLFDGVRQETQLLGEIERLNAELAAQDKQRLEQDIALASSHIVPNYEALAGLLHTWAQAAEDQGLLFSYLFEGEPRATDLDNVARVPVALEVKINVQSAANDGYFRLLRYLRYTESQTWIKELRLSEIEAENGQARILRLAYDLWIFNDGAEAKAPETHEDISPVPDPIDIASS